MGDGKSEKYICPILIYGAHTYTHKSASEWNYILLRSIIQRKIYALAHCLGLPINTWSWSKWENMRVRHDYGGTASENFQRWKSIQVVKVNPPIYCMRLAYLSTNRASLGSTSHSSTFRLSITLHWPQSKAFPTLCWGLGSRGPLIPPSSI